MARTPFFGRGPAPQIARMDMAAATAPGRSWGAAIQGLGETGRDVILDREAQKKEQQLAAGEIKIQTQTLNYFLENAPESMRAGLEEMKEQLNDPNVSQAIRAEIGSRGVKGFLARVGQQQQLDAVAEKKQQLEADKAFRTWALTSQPGQLTPEGEELARGFRESRGDALSEFEGFMERIGGRPISADQKEQFLREQDVREEERLAQERGPSGAPLFQPSARFTQLATKAGLPPRAGMRAYVIAQQKVAQEQAAATARLSGVESGEKLIQLVNKPTGDLRKEFQALPSVKDFNKVNAAYNKIRNAFTAIKRLPDKKKAAADMAVIFSYMKILDPGSTVREGEYASARNTTGVPGKVINLWNNMVDGQILNDEQRDAFQEVARDTAQAQFDDLNVQIDFYKSIAEKKEIDASRVIPGEYLIIAEKGLPKLPSTGEGAGDSDSTLTTPGGDFRIGPVTPLPQ